MAIDIHLYKNFPFSDNTHRFYTKDKNTRDTFFNKFISKTLTSQKTPNLAENYFVVNMNLTIVNDYNYLDFTHKNQKYFAFIKNVQWDNNDKVCKIYFSIDLFQTYIYECTFNQCLIERKNVTDDTQGKYLLDEGLTPPRLIATSQDFFDVFNKTNLGYFCMKVSDTTEIYTTLSNGETQEIYNICNPSPNEYSSAILIFTSKKTLQNVINIYTDRGRLDAIISVYYCNPSQVTLGNCYVKSTDGEKIEFNYIKSASPQIQQFKTTKPTSFGTYLPKNKKCLNYPFNFCEINNCKGQSVNLKYEMFSTDDVKIGMFSSFLEDVGSYCFPLNYENIALNLKNVITGKGCIEIPWISDTYASYYASNKNTLENSFKYIGLDNQIATNNLTYSHIKSGIGQAKEKDFKALGWNVADLFKDKMNLDYQSDKSYDNYYSALADMSNKPDMLKGNYTVNLLYILKKSEYSIIKWQCTEEYIKSIDSYFTKYGYKINQIQTPNLHTHSNFNYIKTNDCNITGNIPQIAKEYIQGLFDKGVTLWHTENIYKYTTDNEVL